MGYKIKEVAQMTNCSEHTLRFYEKEGLIPAIKRNQAGIREYTDHDIECVYSVICLKNTGMGLHEIKKFLQLLTQGESTYAQQREIVLLQKQVVEQKIQTLNAELEHINKKIAFYDNALKNSSV